MAFFPGARKKHEFIMSRCHFFFPSFFSVPLLVNTTLRFACEHTCVVDHGLHAVFLK